MCLTGRLLSLIAPPLAMAGAVRPIRTEWFTARGVISVTTLGLGAVLAIWAQRHLAGEWRAGVEASDSLITSGPFARVRNPFYLGCFFASASVLVAVSSAVALAGLALHIAAAEVIVRGVEEPILAQAHGAEFSSYKQRTGRFLLTVSFGRMRAGDPAGYWAPMDRRWASANRSPCQITRSRGS